MENHRSGCPINLMLEVLGDKWSLLIIRDMMFGEKRYFREFLKSDEKIASNILTDRLAMLEREGIISKMNDPNHKQKVIYSLTAIGINLLPVLVEIGTWSIQNRPVDLENNKFAVELVNGGKVLQTKIKKQLIKNHLL